MKDNQEKKQYELNIAGKKLSVVSADDKAYVEKLSKELTQRINEFLFSGANVDKLSAALICALDLLDENTRLKAAPKGEKKETK